MPGLTIKGHWNRICMTRWEMRLWHIFCLILTQKRTSVFWNGHWILQKLTRALDRSFFAGCTMFATTARFLFLNFRLSPTTLENLFQLRFLRTIPKRYMTTRTATTTTHLNNRESIYWKCQITVNKEHASNSTLSMSTATNSTILDLCSSKMTSTQQIFIKFKPPPQLDWFASRIRRSLEWEVKLDSTKQKLD